MRPASFHAFSTGSYSWQKGEATAGSCAPPQATIRPPTYTACRSLVGRGKGASGQPGEEEVFSETFVKYIVICSFFFAPFIVYQFAVADLARGCGVVASDGNELAEFCQFLGHCLFYFEKLVVKLT